MIEIENLNYSYPRAEIPALVDITCTINRGEFVLLAGPSGAGKSTLLRALNGLVPHYSGGRVKGRVIVDDTDVLAVGPKRMSSVVGFVFQDPETQNVLDIVEDEMVFGLENAAVPTVEMRRRLDEVTKILELSELRERQINTLSGGERQRVAIASVLVMRPSIIALDEPTSQLDPQSASDLLSLLVRLNKDWGMTVVLVEHRLERVAKHSNRILYLENGRLTLDEPIEKGLAHLAPQDSPPLSRLALTLGWDSIPLTTREGARQRDLAGLKLVSEKLKDPPAQRSNGPLLETHDLHFSYGNSNILKGVDLKVKAGESVALIGKNGSGKSTLLKCLVGLLTPAKGQIFFQGESIVGREVSEICQEMAFLPQNPDDLLFAESVIAELNITLENHHLTPETLPNSPAELLNDLDLSSYADSYPRDLSAGQRQRVALGAVVITAPKMVLLDEPTRGLDYNAKSKLTEMWRGWQSEGTGLLLVTHDVELVARACDRVLILDEGKVVADGPTSEVLDENPIFRPQLARLFPGYGWMTVNDAVDGIGAQRT